MPPNTLQDQLKAWQALQKPGPVKIDITPVAQEIPADAPVMYENINELPRLTSIVGLELARPGDEIFLAVTPENTVAAIVDRRRTRTEHKAGQDRQPAQIKFDFPDGTSMTATATEMERMQMSNNAFRTQRAQYWSTIAQTALTVAGVVFLGLGAVAGIRAETHKSP